MHFSHFDSGKIKIKIMVLLVFVLCFWGGSAPLRLADHYPEKAEIKEKKTALFKHVSQ